MVAHLAHTADTADTVNAPGGNVSRISTLDGAVAVITGAASGIGRGMARAFAAQGASVVCSDIDADGAQATADELASTGVETLAMACDVADRSQVDALAAEAWARFGRVDVVCANAGIAPAVRGPVIDLEEDDIRTVVEVNLMGAWRTCAVFGRRLVEQDTPSHIIVTGSENSLGVPAPMMGFYTIGKHGLLGMTDLMRQELPDHVGVSIVMPGIVATNLTPALSVDDDEAEPTWGLNANTMGRHVVQAMLDGEYHIVAHPPVVELVTERTAELEAAFARQAPRREGDERLDTRHAMATIIAQMRASADES